MRPDIRKVLERCIEEGASLGYSRAHKNTDNPSRADITDNICDAIWLQIDEYFNFEKPY